MPRPCQFLPSLPSARVYLEQVKLIFIENLYYLSRTKMEKRKISQGRTWIVPWITSHWPLTYGPVCSIPSPLLPTFLGHIRVDFNYRSNGLLSDEIQKGKSPLHRNCMQRWEKKGKARQGKALVLRESGRFIQHERLSKVINYWLDSSERWKMKINWDEPDAVNVPHCCVYSSIFLHLPLFRR